MKIIYKNVTLKTQIKIKICHPSNMKKRQKEMAMGDDGASTSVKELQQMKRTRDEERF